MAAGVALKDLVQYQELLKSRAELQFRLDIERSRGADPAVISHYELKFQQASRSLEEVSQKMERAGISIVLPNECGLARLSAGLSSLSAKQIADAMRSRSGAVFDTLAQRGKILKRNFEDRENVAKLALLLCHLQKDVRESLAGQVREGRLDAPIPILKGEEAVGKKLALVLGRLGMPARLQEGSLVPADSPSEIEVQLQNRRVWVPAELRGRLDENLRKIGEISSKVQMKNAVRQVKQFSESEEAEFAAMQDEYLKLLKEQDELLKDFDEEGNL